MALKYRGQVPLLDAMLKEIGLEGGNINGLTETLSSTAKPNGAAKANGEAVEKN